MPTWATSHLKQMLTPTNRIGFLLQLGYFRVVGRFFVADRFHPADIHWLSKQLELENNIFQLADYAASQTVYRHRQLILYQLGYEAFSPIHRQALQEEAARLTHLKTKPARMLDTLVSYLFEHRIEVPPYNTLRDILTEALNALDDHLQKLIEEGLTTRDRAMLDALLDNSTTSERLESTAGLANGRFPLTRLKHISQSMQPKQIAERVALFRQLKNLFSPLAPLIERLGLSDDTIRYYAQYVLDNRSGQLAERVHERYLRLLAFITHQYLSVGDALILTLNKAVASTLNSCEQTLKDQHYQSRYATASLVGQVSRRSDVHIDTLTEIERTVEQSALNSDQKIDHIRDLLSRRRLGSEQFLVDKQRLAELKMLNQPLVERTDFYLALEKDSLRLQVRVSGLVQVLVFESQTNQSHLLTAILYFQERAGDLLPSSVLPIDFLDMADR